MVRHVTTCHGKWTCLGIILQEIIIFKFMLKQNAIITLIFMELNHTQMLKLIIINKILSILPNIISYSDSD